MHYQSGSVGRVFYARFDHGDDLFAGLEALVRKEKIGCGWLQLFGGMTSAEVVVGPKHPTVPPEPVWRSVTDTREIFGVGSIFWTAEQPLFHLHGALGHHGETITGCVRQRAEIYLVIEALIMELSGLDITRPWFAAGGFNRPEFAGGGEKV